MLRRNASKETHFLDHPDVASLDRSDMFGHVCGLPQQLTSSLGLRPSPASDLKLPVSNILICGLGGSAIGGSVVSRLLREELTVPLQVNRGTQAPAFVGPETLAFVISHSGNTTETLSAFRQLLDARCQVVALTSGGRLAEQARLNRVPLILLPSGMPPRSALGYTTVPLVRQIAARGLCEDPLERVESAAVALEVLQKQLGLASPFPVNRAKQIADLLSGRVVSIYGSQGNLDAVARRWAGQLAENGKQIAFWNTVPETLHNEIVGWSNPRSFLRIRTCVLLRDPADPPRLQRLFDDLDAHLLAGDDHLTITASGKDHWERIFGLVLLGDLVSAYVALLNGEDPTPISAIDSHKARLEKIDESQPGSPASLNE